MERNIQAPALLAPAGDWDCVRAAVENGADAVYFGLDRFNARMRATNFTVADLPAVVEFLHQRGVKGYVTLNTLMFTDELAAAEQYIRQIIAAGVDAIIVQDVGIAGLIRHLSPDFPIHGSTQMTVTSVNGVTFAHELGCEVVVLARECSIKELTKIQAQLAQHDRPVALEMFVHGALCVAYSGQCLTSESLGGRSANRGECAQACRMTYDLVVDGEVMDLGDRRYLLSPQDLAGLEVLPDLMQAGVACLKIEGRLKSPEYVASVTQVYRAAIDKTMAQLASQSSNLSDPTSATPISATPTAAIPTEAIPTAAIPTAAIPTAAAPTPLDSSAPERDRYQLEMAFSRGLYTGWFEGINNQALVHGRYGKKRGVYLGTVLQVETPRSPKQRAYSQAAAQPSKSKRSKRKDGRSPHISPPSTPAKPRIVVQLEPSGVPLKPGDGVMFDGGHPNGQEEGGRLYTVDFQSQQRGDLGDRATLTFGPNAINPRRIQPGDRLWKTSDPALDKAVRQSFSRNTPNFRRPITITLQGEAGTMLEAIAQDDRGHRVHLQSTMALVAAHTNPLTTDRLHQQFARLGNTPLILTQLVNHINGAVMLPVSELNRLRRELVAQLLVERSQPNGWTINPNHGIMDLLPSTPSPDSALSAPTLIPLLRNLPQLDAALGLGCTTVYCEFEDPRRYKDAVQLVRETATHTGLDRRIWVAPPRITKPLENWMLDQVRRCGADGYLVRNYDHLVYFEGDRCIGDFSLNVANPLTAQYFLQQFNLEHLTASYDLNIQQLEQLLSTCPPHWFEVTVHQHMPMFHMEHCVFCTFLSDGTNFTNCGRPCETYEVKLRDRTGAEHRLHADAGCRNTVYNSRAQTGVESLHRLVNAGLQHIRIEFLDESPEQVSQTLSLYQQVLDGSITGTELWQQLKLHNRLGVTRGQLEA